MTLLSVSGVGEIKLLLFVVIVVVVVFGGGGCAGGMGKANSWFTRGTTLSFLSLLTGIGRSLK